MRRLIRSRKAALYVHRADRHCAGQRRSQRRGLLHGARYRAARRQGPSGRSSVEWVLNAAGPAELLFRLAGERRAWLLLRGTRLRHFAIRPAAASLASASMNRTTREDRPLDPQAVRGGLPAGEYGEATGSTARKDVTTRK
ncbi:hypothetical protein ACU4GD_45540 [Cupriavidus basilensis]